MLRELEKVTAEYGMYESVKRTQTMNKMLDAFFIGVDLNEICLFLDCKKDELFLIRGGIFYYNEKSFQLLNEHLVSSGFNKVKETGRWKTLMNLAIHSGKETNPVIDGIEFYENHNDKLVLSIGCFNPFEFRTFFALDLIVNKNRSEIATKLYNQIFSDSSLKGKIIAKDREKICLDRNYTFEELILNYEKIQLIRQNTVDFLKNKDIFEKHNTPFKRGIILEGPPGNGKTLIGKILASTGIFTFMWITSRDFAGYNSVERVKEIYDLGNKLAPTIIFWEDIDLIISDRTSNKDTAILGELLNQLDGVNTLSGIITIATTNVSEVLDKALSQRPNRFDVRIHIDNPDYNTRIKMLSKFMEDVVLSEDIELDVVAERSNGFSGACMKELVLEAKKLAILAGSFNATGKIIMKKGHIEQSFEKTKKIAETAKPVGFL